MATNAASASAAIAALIFAGSVDAQVPPQADPKTAAPAAATAGSQGTAPQHRPAASRNQFFTPVMGIEIEGQGLSLPKGVADDEPIKPAAAPQAPEPASTPAATPK